MNKSIIQYGYCPTKDAEYFINIRYHIFRVNQYKKHDFECAYLLLYGKDCPFKASCPIMKLADEFVV
ncbi:MAG: hypothetical protein ACI4I9_10395 [Porcipelethomonas sp.]